MQDAKRKALGPYRHGYVPVSTRPRCPVCGKGVFSKGGIHPQCAVVRNDSESKASQKELRKAIDASLARGPASAEEQPPPEKNRSTWNDNSP
jgi:hypothetical protein